MSKAVENGNYNLHSEKVGYPVLARRYRPTIMSDVVGQDIVVRVLRNAFMEKRLSHAYLLTGQRGVGKTTLARIIARGLNCIGSDGQGGITDSPCGLCVHCNMISEGRHLDVIEVDAASHTGIENIRHIVDNCQYHPVSGRYKVYIIDEVHMLSSSAFNGLLKTLEEPPEHVVFLLATTELRKIPATILSRCQRLFLQHIPVDVLVLHLQNICQKENISIDEAVLQRIAILSQGACRDALSLLDQVIVAAGGAKTGQSINLSIVNQLLNIPDLRHLQSLIHDCLQGDLPKVFQQLDKLISQIIDPLSLLQDILEYIGYLIQLKTVPSVEQNAGIELYIDLEVAKQFSDKIALPVLLRFWQLIADDISALRQSVNPALLVRMLVIKLTHIASLPSPESLVAQIESHLASRPVKHDVDDNIPTLVSGTMPGSFDALLQLLADKKEIIAKQTLETAFRLVDFSPGRIEANIAPSFSPAQLTDLHNVLRRVTGKTWQIISSEKLGNSTILEQKKNTNKA